LSGFALLSDVPAVRLRFGQNPPPCARTFLNGPVLRFLADPLGAALFLAGRRWRLRYLDSLFYSKNDDVFALFNCLLRLAFSLKSWLADSKF
jgi:hypothetical protein